MVVEEVAYGIIPLRQESSEWQVLLVLHREGNHWAFPKGKGNPGENSLDAAKRELKEETGLAILELLRTDPFVDRYQFQRAGSPVSKNVHYFPAIVTGTLKLQVEEIADAKWVSLKEADTVLTFQEAKNICRSIIELLGG